jgi:hypothetical protein
MRDIVDVDQVYSSGIKATVDALVIPEVRSSLRVQLSIVVKSCVRLEICLYVRLWRAALFVNFISGEDHRVES